MTPYRSPELRSRINYFIDDAMMGTDPQSSRTYLIASRRFLAALVCHGFFFLKQRNLLEEFCSSFHAP